MAGVANDTGAQESHVDWAPNRDVVSVPLSVTRKLRRCMLKGGRFSLTA